MTVKSLNSLIFCIFLGGFDVFGSDSNFGQCSGESANSKMDSSLIISFDYSAPMDCSDGLVNTGNDSKVFDRISTEIMGAPEEDISTFKDAELFSFMCPGRVSQATSLIESWSEASRAERGDIESALKDACPVSPQDAMLAALGEFANSNENYAFFYSGHGTLDRDDREEWQMSVPDPLCRILGRDDRSNKISGTQLAETISPKMAVIDACYSGALNKTFMDHSNTYIVSASLADQKAADEVANASGDRHGNGVLSHMLDSILSEDNDKICNIDMDQDGQISRNELSMTLLLNNYFSSLPSTLRNIPFSDYNIFEHSINGSNIEDDYEYTMDSGYQLGTFSGGNECLFKLSDQANCSRGAQCRPVGWGGVCDQCDIGEIKIQNLKESFANISQNPNYLTMVDMDAQPSGYSGGLDIEAPPLPAENIVLINESRKDSLTFIESWEKDLRADLLGCSKDNPEFCSKNSETYRDLNRWLEDIRKVVSLSSEEQGNLLGTD